MKEQLLNSRIHLSALGMLFAVLTMLFGQFSGIIFGLNEDSIKSRLKAAAAEVRESVYNSDDEAIKKILDKSWVYMQRAHLHAGGMGTTAVALIILTCLLPVSARLIIPVSCALGLGGLGYSVFWMWAGFRAPSLGSTSAAKESLSWLAMPSSGAFVLATLAVLLMLVISILKPKHQDI